MGITKEELSQSLVSDIDGMQRHKVTDDSGFTHGCSDCNELTLVTTYYCPPTAQNIPINGFNGYIHNRSHGRGWGQQEGYDCFGSGGRYVRELLNGTWQPWRSL